MTVISFVRPALDNAHRLATAALLAIVLLIAGCAASPLPTGERSTGGRQAATRDQIDLLPAGESTYRTYKFAIVQWHDDKDFEHGFSDFLRKRFVSHEVEVFHSGISGMDSETIREKISDLSPDAIVVVGYRMTAALLGAGPKEDRVRDLAGIPIIYVVMDDPSERTIGARALIGSWMSQDINVTGVHSYYSKRVQVQAAKSITDFRSLAIVYEPSIKGVNPFFPTLRSLGLEFGFETTTIPVSADCRAIRSISCARNILVAADQAGSDMIYIQADSLHTQNLNELARQASERRISTMAPGSYPAKTSDVFIGYATPSEQVGSVTAYHAMNVIFDNGSRAVVPVTDYAEPILYINQDTARELGVQIPRGTGFALHIVKTRS